MLSYKYENKFFLLTKQSPDSRQQAIREIAAARHCEKAVLSYKYEDKFFLLTKQSPDIEQQTIREIAAARHCEESSVVI